jgi:redox-sensitive bicupin YhaK (pirin superfamily)
VLPRYALSRPAELSFAFKIMIVIRKRAERGHTHIGWLDSWHTFSFGEYHDPRYMGFRSLRVINDDQVAPGAGFPTHGHRDMEIISYVISGELEHKDSIGTGSVIRPGDVQRMSAGTGIRHSEFNASRTMPVHFLQIWIVPEKAGLTPSYEQKHFPLADRTDRLRLVADAHGTGGALKVHQDIRLYAGHLTAGGALELPLQPNRYGWLQIATGSLSIQGQTIHEGDGVLVGEQERLLISTSTSAEVLWFDLA